MYRIRSVLDPWAELPSSREVDPIENASFHDHHITSWDADSLSLHDGVVCGLLQRCPLRSRSSNSGALCLDGRFRSFAPSPARRFHSRNRTSPSSPDEYWLPCCRAEHHFARYDAGSFPITEAREHQAWIGIHTRLHRIANVIACWAIEPAGAIHESAPPTCSTGRTFP